MNDPAQPAPRRAPVLAGAIVLVVLAGLLGAAQWYRDLEQPKPLEFDQSLIFNSVDQAKAAIQAHEWRRARVLLESDLKLGIRVPGVEGLLSQIGEGERRERALEKAAATIQASDATCRVLSDVRRPERVFSAALAGCELVDAPEELIGEEEPLNVAFPIRAEDEAAGLVGEARERLRQRAFPEALAILQRCVAVAPDFHLSRVTTSLATCHKLLGVAHGYLHQLEPARRGFQRYVELAGRGDPEVGLVLRALESLR